MDRVLVVVFSEASEALKARDALKSLDREDVLTLYAYAVITKQPDGTCLVNDEHDLGEAKTLLGTGLGSLIGLLGGAAGVAVGAVAGSLTGITAALEKSRVSAEFLDEVSKELTPGKCALVAEVDEEWSKWVDLCMEELRGTVYRYTLSEVKKAEHAADVAVMKADLALLKAEHAEAEANRQAKLHERINQLETKIQQRLEKEKEQREEADRRDRAKAEILKARASATKAKAAEPQRLAGD